MNYNLMYIEDLDPDTRILTLQDENLSITALKPDVSIDNVINEINKQNPDLIILDYILTEGTNQSLKYCNAPTIASTLRSLIATDEFKERPLILISTKENIIDSYKKDYTSHDLFDYAATKEYATKNKTKFVSRCISFIKGYAKIRSENFNLENILGVESTYINQKIEIGLSQKKREVYEYSRFIYEHLIRCSGLLIGEDVLSARLGVSKESKDWQSLLTIFESAKYNGIFSESYNRWWMQKIDHFWRNQLKQRYSLRHYDASERVDILKEVLGLELSVASSSKMNTSNNYWVICVESKLPLDPSEGLELLDEEIMPWQDNNYVSIESYLENVEVYSAKVSLLDRAEMRKFKR